ncbi:MAG: ATP-binding cassette domain-containing protein [Verrucomicrobiota bacterium]|nr:ATP-binding cassette domain-containing protein [Verrucomicrobiota bacterium]
MQEKKKEPVLSARGIGLQRGKRWLFRNLDLDLYAGEFLAIVGPSGVGKTTLLSCLCGTLQPTEGSVSFKLSSTDGTKPEDLRRHFGIVYQELQLIPNADLLTNVLCGQLGRFHCLSTLLGFPKKHRQEAYELLCELGVGENPHKWINHISGGEKQRVAAARVLFQKPKIYFADEPVSSLDAYYAGRVLGLLRQEADEKAKPVLCVLHNAEHIQRFADIALSLNQSDPKAHNLRRVRPENGKDQL